MEEHSAIASWINLGEVYYVEVRSSGEQAARTAIDSIADRIETEEPDRDLILAAARIKAANSISYGDTFAIATAQRHDAPIVTGDPEILALAGNDLKVIDPRPGKSEDSESESP